MSISQSDREARSLTASPLARGALYAFLVFMALIGAWGSWKSLFAYDLVMTIVYTLLALVGMGGSWLLYQADLKLRDRD